MLDVEAWFNTRRKMPELTITAVARKMGIRPSTLRYYERIGLLPTAQRVAGRRRYDNYSLKQVELIAYAKRAGFTLAQIRSVQENASLGKSPALLWRDLATRKAAELDQVIVRAQQAKKRLVTLSQCRCRSLAKCGDFPQSSRGQLNRADRSRDNVVRVI
jgi:MerR family redox-sensitive transcriptional activator SoxR